MDSKVEKNFGNLFKLIISYQTIMKVLATTSLFLLLIGSVYGQEIIVPWGHLIFKDTLALSPLNSWITIPGSNKVWEIGIPDKLGMNDSSDGLPAIVTGLHPNYPLNSGDYFTLEIPYRYIWGEGILSFWHKYDTDSLKDGGLIELSQDGGNTWANLVNSRVGLRNIYNGLYSTKDTINGGIPAFTGKSGSWKKVELYWWWMALTHAKSAGSSNGFVLRFKFISGPDSTPKGGWEISHFEFSGYDISGGMNDISNRDILVSPNPANDKIKLSITDFSRNLIFRLFNQSGIQLLDIPIKMNSQDINIKDLRNGSYIYTICQDKSIIKSGQIIKQ